MIFLKVCIEYTRWRFKIVNAILILWYPGKNEQWDVKVNARFEGQNPQQSCQKGRIQGQPLRQQYELPVLGSRQSYWTCKFNLGYFSLAFNIIF